MPEGHLIHRFAGQLRDDLGGRTVRATSPQGRFDAAAVDGHRLVDVRAVRLSTADATGDLIAPSTCELLDPAGLERVLGALGPDPLGPDEPDRAVGALCSFRGVVGAALLDQSVWAGIGNAWRAELLYLARLHPSTPCRDLSAHRAAELWVLRSSPPTCLRRRDRGSAAQLPPRKGAEHGPVPCGHNRNG